MKQTISPRQCVQDILLQNAYLCEAGLCFCTIPHSYANISIALIISEFRLTLRTIGASKRKTGLSQSSASEEQKTAIICSEFRIGTRRTERALRDISSRSTIPPGGKERYWDQVALEYHLDEYKIAVRECSFDDIAEIDTYREHEAESTIHTLRDARVIK